MRGPQTPLLQSLPMDGSQTSEAPTLHALAGLVPAAMLRDQHTARSRLKRAEELVRTGRPADQLLKQAAGDLERSVALRRQRQASLPKPRFPDHLPVVERRGEIAEVIGKHQVIVLCGETGSGKTTQLPKICLELGRGVAGMIGHTQPRRIAARSVASRIAQELDTAVGQVVGFKVRFTDKSSNEATYIKLMTDGILLAETQGDRYLEQYDTIIIDEAHERSLNIDFLLGYLKQLLPRRPDLKVIITSATIDPERFSKHFNDAPMLMVSGRTYPVETRYRPLTAPEVGPDEGPASDEEDPADDLTIEDGIAQAVQEVYREGPGDILIFLTGEREIRETAELLRQLMLPHTEVLPLYARLSAEDQMRVFKPHPGRRIVLATNVAETSLTVPGIRFVIDPGYARLSRYSPRTKVQRLPIEPISQASADQRKGRCGRVEAGVCIRLYSEGDYLARPKYTDPEIVRTNLASVILQMKALRLGDIQEFPFIDPPDYRAIKDGFQTLHELGAIDENNELTPLGNDLARLPIDPRIGRMILAAADEGVMREVLIIASALSVQDPRERPMDKAELADQAQAQFRDENSDFVSYLRLWETYHAKARELSASKLRKFCQQNFLSFVRMREWHDIHQQLLGLVTEMGLERRKTSAPAGPVASRVPHAPTQPQHRPNPRHRSHHRTRSGR
jgi:ATP-dependent helicase HrpA